MRPLLFLSAILWLSAAAGGVSYLARFKNTAADPVVGYPAVFPPQSRLERDGDRPTLIFFAHPKCPCTRASLNELARLMTDINNQAKAYVVFIKPADADDDWLRTDMFEIARAIPNVQVVVDQDERETSIFNAQTSSLTLLYDRQGDLRFNGGITAARGHEGDNAGRAAIVEIVTADADNAAQTPVFGCPLHEKDCPGKLDPAAHNVHAIGEGENQ